MALMTIICMATFRFRGRVWGWRGWHDNNRAQCSIIFWWQKRVGFVAIIVLGGLVFNACKLGGIRFRIPILGRLFLILFLKINGNQIAIHWSSTKYFSDNCFIIINIPENCIPKLTYVEYIWPFCPRFTAFDSFEVPISYAKL